MKFIKKKAIYKGDTCEECIFANGFEPCTKFCHCWTGTQCCDELKRGYFPLRIDNQEKDKFELI